METLLDDSVRQKVELQIERGGIPLTVNLTVQDLHSITPDYFLEVSGAVIHPHPLSYQQVASYEFTTLTCIPGVIVYRGAKIQVMSNKLEFDPDLVDLKQIERKINIFRKWLQSLANISYRRRYQRSLLS